jgi:hypothetical protein
VTGTGKIARLPQAVREELNRRRCETEPGSPLAERFGGGEAGRLAAALDLELRRDLELGTLTRKPEPGPAGSNPVKPSQT